LVFSDRRCRRLFGGVFKPLVGGGFAYATFSFKASIALLASTLPALATGLAAEALSLFAIGAGLAILPISGLPISGLPISGLPVSRLTFTATTVAIPVAALIPVTPFSLTAFTGLLVAWLTILVTAILAAFSGLVGRLLGGKEGRSLGTGFIFEVDIEALVG
jgi:hypothetical protein